MNYENKVLVVLLVVHFELRRYYGIFWCPNNIFGWRSHLNNDNKEMVVLLVVHFELRRYYGIMQVLSNTFGLRSLTFMTIQSWRSFWLSILI